MKYLWCWYFLVIFAASSAEAQEKKERLWTAECVSSGHPDKIADQISDAILDAYLCADPQAKVACETLFKGNTVVVAGEITSTAHISIEPIVHETIKKIGYTNLSIGFDIDTCKIIQLLSEQSSEIQHAVEEKGAGDQGIMFGYATNETSTYMPLVQHLCRRLMDAYELARRFELLLYPDAKTQVTLYYNEEGSPERSPYVVFSFQHSDQIPLAEVRAKFYSTVLPLFLSSLTVEERNLFDENTEFMINFAGAWNIGGPVADAGVTGRKIVIDQYGPDCPIGGGAFSGKDPSKVDRSGAYMARYIAKNIVHAGLAREVTVQLAYLIGKKEPVSFCIDTHNTSELSNREIIQMVQERISLDVHSIIERFHLKQPIYQKTVCNGPFGNDEAPWEQLDLFNTAQCT